MRPGAELIEYSCEENNRDFMQGISSDRLRAFDVDMHPRQQRQPPQLLSDSSVHAVFSHNMRHVFIVFGADVLHEILVHARHPRKQRKWL